MSASNVKLIMQPEIYYQVHRLVHSISHDPNLYEDLLQEASLCFWRAQATHPGQKTSWYRQRCRFSIYGYLGAGRSVDSLKHRAATCPYGDPEPPEPADDHNLLQEICTRDAFAELMRHLGPEDQQTLRLLGEEWTAREIARKLHVSHVAIVLRRRHIAATALRLGIGL